LFIERVKQTFTNEKTLNIISINDLIDSLLEENVRDIHIVDKRIRLSRNSVKNILARRDIIEDKQLIDFIGLIYATRSDSQGHTYIASDEAYAALCSREDVDSSILEAAQEFCQKHIENIIVKLQKEIKNGK
jgi:hypothetical protein